MIALAEIAVLLFFSLILLRSTDYLDLPEFILCSMMYLFNFRHGVLLSFTLCFFSRTVEILVIFFLLLAVQTFNDGL